RHQPARATAPLGQQPITAKQRPVSDNQYFAHLFFLLTPGAGSPLGLCRHPFLIAEPSPTTATRPAAVCPWHLPWNNGRGRSQHLTLPQTHSNRDEVPHLLNIGCRGHPCSFHWVQGSPLQPTAGFT